MTKIIALAVAGLSTAAIAQTNVTIYGVADLSAQGYSTQSGKAQPLSASAGQANGGSFNVTNNSSLIGFKGTEALGNGVNALFQIETNVNLNGTGNAANSTTGTTFGSMRDSYVGVSGMYGTVLGGFLSTPYRSSLTGLDVMPGATGSGRNENMIGAMRLNSTNVNNGLANAVSSANTGGVAASASVRTTAVAYALPTLYGINGSIAYTGNNNGSTTSGRNEGNLPDGTGATLQTVQPQQGGSVNLGWDGYGVGIRGAYQQVKVNYAQGATNALQGYTSYLIGAQYTGVPGLKVSGLYARNSLGMNGTPTIGAQKGSNNQVWIGASYRFGNNEPRLSFASTSDTSGLTGMGQDGGRQWTANWGYYLSKRTQVYGLVSGISNAANGIWTMGGNATNVLPTGGQNILTYGAGLRTNF